MSRLAAVMVEQLPPEELQAVDIRRRQNIDHGIHTGQRNQRHPLGHNRRPGRPSEPSPRTSIRRPCCRGARPDGSGWPPGLTARDDPDPPGAPSSQRPWEKGAVARKRSVVAAPAPIASSAARYRTPGSTPALCARRSLRSRSCGTAGPVPRSSGPISFRCTDSRPSRPGTSTAAVRRTGTPRCAVPRTHSSPFSPADSLSCGCTDPRRLTRDPPSPVSPHVLTELRIPHEGRLRHTLLLRDGWRDPPAFSILGEEWHTSRNAQDSLSRNRLAHPYHPCVGTPPAGNLPALPGNPQYNSRSPLAATGGKGAHPTHTVGASDA